jgi:ABC-2 type transport system ATP-binding protein
MSQALLGRPDLLLLDEPTTGMDPAQVIEVREAIATSAAAGATVVLSSHHLSEVEEVCTHAAVLRTGRLLAAGAMAGLVQRHHRVHVSVDDAERAAAVLDSRAGVAGVAAVDRSTVVVNGISLRGIDLVVALDEAGIAVAGFRGSTFEDTYLSLFDDGSLTSTGPPPELP